MLALLLASQGLSADLDAHLSDPLLASAIVAAKVTTMTGDTVYEHNSFLLVMPASNQKILTTAYALEVLGPSYRPQTRIWKLKDRIVVDSPGDPSLTYSRLVQARRDLRLKKPLPVYVRQAYRPGIPSDWELDDLPNRYAAPVTAFTVDRGSFELWGKSGRAFFKPASFGTTIVRGDKLGYDPFRKVATVAKIPKGESRLDTLALPAPDRAAASVLGGAFATAKSVPSSLPTLVLTGDSVGEVVRECLVKSDNNLAENLLLMAAAKEGPLGGDAYETARKRLEAFLLRRFAIVAEEVRPMDGSGLSRHNLLSVSTLGSVLRGMGNGDKQELWRSCLASPGNGTLKERLEGSTFVGKTGSLDAVNALSGYVRGADGQTLVVCLVLNHYKGEASQIRALMDSFVRKIEATRPGR